MAKQFLRFPNPNNAHSGGTLDESQYGYPSAAIGRMANSVYINHPPLYQTKLRAENTLGYVVNQGAMIVPVVARNLQATRPVSLDEQPRYKKLR